MLRWLAGVRRPLLLLGVLCLGCDGADPNRDAGVDASLRDGGRDAGVSSDSGAHDAGADAGTDAGRGDSGLDAGGTDAGASLDASTDGSVAILNLIEMACQHSEDCGTLSGGVPQCVANSSDTYGDIIAVCPEEMSTLRALLECFVAASCPAEPSCTTERAAADAARIRCLGS